MCLYTLVMQSDLGFKLVTGKGDPVAVLMNIRTRPLPAKGYKQDEFKYTFINEIISSIQ